jgi:hypothetical protein
MRFMPETDEKRLAGVGWWGIQERLQTTSGGPFDTKESLDHKWLVRALNGDFWTNENRFFTRLREEPRWRLFDGYGPMYGCPVQ